MNPYSLNLNKLSDDGELKEDLIELRSNSVLDMQFESKSFEEYWCSGSAVVVFPRPYESALNFAHSICDSIPMRVIVGFGTFLSIETNLEIS